MSYVSRRSFMQSAAGLVVAFSLPRAAAASTTTVVGRKCRCLSCGRAGRRCYDFRRQGRSRHRGARRAPSDCCRGAFAFSETHCARGRRHGAHARSGIDRRFNRHHGRRRANTPSGGDRSRSFAGARRHATQSSCCRTGNARRRGHDPRQRRGSQFRRTHRWCDVQCAGRQIGAADVTRIPIRSSAPHIRVLTSRRS